jgi:hypothetical protein
MKVDNSQKRRILLLKDTRGFFKTLNISNSTKLQWRKQKVDASLLQTAELPGYFMAINKKLVPYNEEMQEKLREKIIGCEQDKRVILNNMEILQGRTEIQKLGEKDISSLREKETGKELIGIIANHNKNFDKRTTFSKQKYIDKKMKKYMMIFYVEEVNMKNVNGKVC